MLEKIKNFICNHFDLKIYPVTYFAIITILLVYPAARFLPIEYGYENSLIENTQLFALIVIAIISIKAKVNKKFFYFAAMVIGILFLREINCGRTIFFAVPNTVNTFYSWDQIKYGYLAHPLYGLYMAYVAFYFLKNKLFINLWQLIKNIKFPVWNIVLMIIGIVVGLYSENYLNNPVLEEMTELLFYVSLGTIIYLYGFNKKFNVEQ